MPSHFCFPQLCHLPASVGIPEKQTTPGVSPLDQGILMSASVWMNGGRGTCGQRGRRWRILDHLRACGELISWTTGKRACTLFLQRSFASSPFYGLKVRTAIYGCAGCSLYNDIQPKEQVRAKIQPALHLLNCVPWYRPVFTQKMHPFFQACIMVTSKAILLAYKSSLSLAPLPRVEYCKCLVIPSPGMCWGGGKGTENN